MLDLIGAAAKRLPESDLAFVGINVGDDALIAWDHNRGFRRIGGIKPEVLAASWPRAAPKMWSGPIEHWEKVRQVLFNLLSNSAKFTEGGTITLTARKPVESTNVTFGIRDTGFGMREEQLGRQSKAFSRANSQTSRKYGGPRLGLALSREFCRMMEGDITVESVLGKGSTFTVTSPVCCVDSEPVS